MSKLRTLGVQLTIRCDMRCAHCFFDLGKGDMPLDQLRDLAEFAVKQGCSKLSFTGGEPTLHGEFAKVLEIVAEHDLRFGIITNAWGFAESFPTLLEHRERLEVLDFSLDGAVAATHDACRRKGSFERVLEAARACRAEEVPFGLRFAATRANWEEIEPAIELAEKLGAAQISLIPMQPSETDPKGELLPSPMQLTRLAAGIGRLREGRQTRVALTVGHFSLELEKPCPTYAERSLFVTARGDVSLCCQLGGYTRESGNEDVVGNLHEMPIGEAWERILQRTRKLKQAKLELRDEGRLSALDYFPLLVLHQAHGEGHLAVRIGRPLGPGSRPGSLFRTFSEQDLIF